MMGRIALVVEDDDRTAKLLTHILHTIDLHSYRVGSLEEMKHIVKSVEFDVALVDLMLPDCKDHDTVREAAKVLTDTPFIVVSGFIKQEDADKIMKEGAAGVLIKCDFDVDALLQAIHNALKIREAKLHFQSLQHKIDAVRRAALDMKETRHE